MRTHLIKIGILSALLILQPMSYAYSQSEKTDQELLEENLQNAEKLRISFQRLDSLSIDTLIQKINGYIDLGINIHIEFLSLTSSIVAGILDLEEAYSIIPDTLILEVLRSGRGEFDKTGSRLRWGVLNGCIKSQMKKIMNAKHNKPELVESLLEYYTLYQEVYEVDENTAPYYKFLDEKIIEFKEKKVRISSRIELLMD